MMGLNCLKKVYAGAKLMREISNNRREKVSLKNLIIGLECGRSDPSSGIIKSNHGSYF